MSENVFGLIIIIDDKKKFDAFISYSHLDKSYAGSIQRSLETLGQPWYRRWKPDLTIFRDERKMQLADSLNNEIKRGLEQSRFLIVLASRHAAGSNWVKEEVLQWYHLNHDEQGNIKNFNFILLDDIVVWDSKQQDFDFLKTTALPNFGFKLFNAMPLWANLQPYCNNQVTRTDNANYQWEVAKIKGLLLGRSPDQIIDDVSAGRRKVSLITAIIILTLIGLTVFAFLQRSSATKQRDRATSRELLLTAEKLIHNQPDLSLHLAIRAAEKQLKTDGFLSDDLRAALRRMIQVNNFFVPVQFSPGAFRTNGVESFAISPDNMRLAIGSQDTLIRVLSNRDYKILYQVKQSWTNSVSFTSDNKYLASSGQQDSLVNIWDAVTGRNIKILSNESQGFSVDWRWWGSEPRGVRMAGYWQQAG